MFTEGVGTGYGLIDTIAGGLLGIGISEVRLPPVLMAFGDFVNLYQNIREAYSFIAAK